MQGRRRRQNHNESSKGSMSVGDSHGETSHRSGSHRSRERSQDFTDGESVSPEQRRHRSAAMDAMSHALRRAAQLPFSDEIEHAPLPRRFSIPPFISYDKKENPIEHVSHYIQMMSLYNQNDAFICKVFPPSLRPTALRWFNGLRKGSIHNFGELIQEFGCSVHDV